ncbi:MAG TPA: hypothetical protein VKR24_07835 [Candidatus Limnocylindrales bacterium]|nr:hypothetical protein [Candidatus Limnocylindrales bacterium]
MTDQDQDQDQEPGKLGSTPTDVPVLGPTDVEGHGTPRARVAADDEDDVEGHFSTIRSTGSKGE